MKSFVVAPVLGMLTLASLGAVTLVAVHPASHPGADPASLHGGMAGDAMDAQLGMERLAFPQAAGSVPSSDDAKKLPQLSTIDIRSDADFTPANGVRSGAGTLTNPYLISGYDVTGDLWISDTNACFEIAGNWIDGQLHLNWNGQCVHVHHNFIRDLRVNENNARTGFDTGGLIELNQIDYVGQIRHYDGEFRNNVVGPRDDGNLPQGLFNDPENQLPFAKDTRVLNIDGWNQAIFSHNTVIGSVDLKLHGHHHSSGFLATHSHYHGDNQSLMMATDDHSDRWTSVTFSDNLIVDPNGYGLRYTDENHAGDDRTANSETTKQLDDPHQHHTWVTIQGNELEGAGIIVDIFNADDVLHKWVNPGWFTIAQNTIHLKGRDPGILGQTFFGPTFDPNTAIKVWTVKEVQLHIAGNVMSWEPASQQDPTTPVQQALPFLFGGGGDPTAVSLDGVRNANVMLSDNSGTGFVNGIQADQMDNATHWYVQGNSFPQAAHALYYDSTVANKPQDGPGPNIPVETYTRDRQDMGMH
ncbi:MAG: hypothetical protein ACYDBQ_09180 [Thermoplasmatota archaeon]